MNWRRREKNQLRAEIGGNTILGRNFNDGVTIELCVSHETYPETRPICTDMGTRCIRVQEFPFSDISPSITFV